MKTVRRDKVYFFIHSERSTNTMTTTITSLLLLVALLLLLINPLASSLKFLPERKKKQLTKKREKEGWRKTKDGWLRLDLPPDSMLRVGVTYRPNDCP